MKKIHMTKERRELLLERKRYWELQWRKANQVRYRKYQREYRIANSKKIRLREKKWRVENRERVTKWHREWRKKNRDRLIPLQRNAALVRNYGITLDQYNEMLSDQGGKCAICEMELKKPYVDHCHRTGKVRGILCPSCNLAIGIIREDMGIWLSIKNYLWTPENHPKIMFSVMKEEATQ